MMMTLTLFLMASCQPDKKLAQDQPSPQQHPASQKPPVSSHQPKTAIPNSHTVVTQQVIQGNSYTYLNVEENNETFWIAVRKTEMTPGEIFSFTDSLKMPNFTSKELQRTFDVIYFVGAIDKDGSPPAAHPSIDSNRKIPIGHLAIDPHHEKPSVHPSGLPGSILVKPAPDGISIGELFASKASYSGKTIRIRGNVTKVNLSIMDKNWIHLQDGTGGSGTNDLLVTTDAEATVGDTITFEGTIVLDRDFGAGYKYELLMEKAKLIN